MSKYNVTTTRRGLNAHGASYFHVLQASSFVLVSSFVWLRMRAKQICYLTLSRVLGFDRWHYLVVRENCGYFEKLRDLHGAIRPRTTIEVGCGLGEIISGLNSEVRIGVDREAAVIKAARVIRPHRVSFFVDSDIDAERISAASRGSVCLVFLNWFHGYTADELQSIVGRYIKGTAASHVIFDVINETALGYRYRHPPELLGSFGTINGVADAGDSIRRLVIVDIRRSAAVE